jgi:hypothetical protein
VTTLREIQDAQGPVFRRLSCPAPRCPWLSGVYHIGSPDFELDMYHHHYLLAHLPSPKVLEFTKSVKDGE